MGSSIPSFTTMIQDGINGYIIEIDQPEAIASKIKGVMQLDTDTRDDLRQKARATVLEYGPEGYYRRFMQMLDQLETR